MSGPYTIDTGSGTTETALTVQEALKDAKVMSVKRLPDGRFRVREECDGYYGAWLTQEQLLALADELRAMAMGANP